jgi:hypothetical protein
MRCYNCKLNGICRGLRNKSQEHFKWSFHNLVAHPISEIVWLLGFRKLSDSIHDKSVPKHEEGQGRG